ncbi:MAG TPA: 4-hydroxy-tetrahydrodipicolinate synthase, partial [Armatimonadota bacterium]|nr:4-hydroxy-tetrahydrodipicolinate synthase [Armatimonadota bacterium]
GNNDTKDTCEFTAEASKLDLDAVMLVGPYYNKPSQEGLFQHFKAGAAATELPVIAYNVPGRTSKNIETDTTVRLAEEIDNIAAVKEASGDMLQISEIIRRVPDDFAVYSGDDFITLPMLSLGAKGIISVVSNVAGNIVQDMVSAYYAGDTARAAALHHKLFPLYDACFLPSGNPACVKRAMQISGWDPGGVRLPVIPASEADTAQIREACEGIGLASA